MRLVIILLIFICFGSSTNFAASHEIKDKNTQITYQIDQGQSIAGYGRYIKPNEYSPYLFEPAIKGKLGMLIAVGSFRALIDFGMGSFDYGLFFDFDASIGQFHQAHFDLIAAIAQKIPGAQNQRLAYLAALHNSDDKPSSDEAVWDKHAIKSFIEHVSCPAASMNDFALAMKKIYELKMREESFEKWFCEIGKSLSEYYHRTYLNDMRNAYYWEDDDKWQRVVTAIQEKRIAIVSGKIDDLNHWDAIKTIINKLETQVSVIDLSNIPSTEWLHDEGMARNLTKNIFALPRSEDAVILYTAQPDDMYPRKAESKLLGEDGNWKYLKLPRDKFFYIGKIF